MQTILKRLADAEGDEHLSFTLKHLAPLSEEQHLELDKAVLEDELGSSRIVDVTKKGTKVGQGLKFLPRKLNDLVKGLWLEELIALLKQRDDPMFETKLVLYSKNFRGAMESLTRNIPPLKRTIIYFKQNCIIDEIHFLFWHLTFLYIRYTLLNNYRTRFYPISKLLRAAT